MADGPFVEAKVYAKVGCDAGGKLPAVTSIGCYTLVYYTRRGDELCAKCASTCEQEDDPVVEVDTYDEGPDKQCANCNCTIESSYGDPDDDKEEKV